MAASARDLFLLVHGSTAKGRYADVEPVGFDRWVVGKEACRLRFDGRRAALFSLGSLALAPLVRSCPSSARARTLGGWNVPARSEAMDVARAVVGGTCGVLVHVDRIRHLPAARRLLSLGQWGAAMEHFEIDPLEEVSRVFVTSRKFDDTVRSATVIDLAIDDTDRVTRRLLDLERAPDCALGGILPIDGARFAIESPAPGSLVVVPEESLGALAERRALIRGGSCLPAASEDEVIYGFAEEPDTTLGDALPWPATVRDVHARLALTPGGATLEVFARSTSPEQAALDARTLSAALDAKLRVDLVLFQLSLLRETDFEVRGDRIELATRLGKTEVEILLALGSL